MCDCALGTIDPRQTTTTPARGFSALRQFAALRQSLRLALLARRQQRTARMAGGGAIR